MFLLKIRPKAAVFLHTRLWFKSGCDIHIPLLILAEKCQKMSKNHVLKSRFKNTTFFKQRKKRLREKNKPSTDYHITTVSEFHAKFFVLFEKNYSKSEFQIQIIPVSKFKNTIKQGVLAHKNNTYKCSNKQTSN